MTSIGTGLRMMQAGGVDRTGFADIADALGNPGLDLIRRRREEQGLAALLASLSENQIEPTVDKPIDKSTDEKGMTSLSFSDVALGLLDPVTTGIDLIKGASKRMTPEEISLFYQGDPMDQLYGGYGFDKSREMFDLQKGDTNIFGNEVLMDSPMLVDPEVRALYESALGMQDGGPVSVGMDDNRKTLRISEDDKFIEAEQMLRGDTELYNYLVGGEIMPGLSFELGVMDDAVMEPGMRSPDDLKFFNIKKTF